MPSCAMPAGAVPSAGDRATEHPPLTLAEGIVGQHREAAAGERDREGLEIGLRFRLGVPMPRHEQDRRNPPRSGNGNVEMRRHLDAGKGLIDELLETIALPLEDADGTELLRSPAPADPRAPARPAAHGGSEAPTRPRPPGSRGGGGPSAGCGPGLPVRPGSPRPRPESRAAATGPHEPAGPTPSTGPWSSRAPAPGPGSDLSSSRLDHQPRPALRDENPRRRHDPHLSAVASPAWSSRRPRSRAYRHYLAPCPARNWIAAARGHVHRARSFGAFCSGSSAAPSGPPGPRPLLARRAPRSGADCSVRRAPDFRGSPSPGL